MRGVFNIKKDITKQKMMRETKARCIVYLVVTLAHTEVCLQKDLRTVVCVPKETIINIILS